MKKVLLLLVALFVTTAVNAQFDICIGPKLGYQATKLSFDKQTIKSDFKGNMTFGLFGRVTIKRFIVQPELLYYKSGKMFEFQAFENGPFSQVNPTFTIKQSNLALPVFLGYQFVDLDLLKMRANFGPVFNFAVGKAEFVMSDNSTNKEESPMEDVAIGAALNLGVDIWRFTLDVNYSFGLTESLDDEMYIPNYGKVDIGADAKENIFTVTLGFKFL